MKDRFGSRHALACAFLTHWIGSLGVHSLGPPILELDMHLPVGVYTTLGVYVREPLILGAEIRIHWTRSLHFGLESTL